MVPTVETTVTTAVDKGNASEFVRKIELKYYQFVVENYSVRKAIGVGECITSGEIVVGGHRFTVNLYPQGKTEDAHGAGYSSIFITSDIVEPVQILHYFFIADQSGKLDHICFSSLRSRQVEFLSISRGYHRFLSRAELDSPNSRYLKHDSLKITVCIGVFYYHRRVRNHSSSSSTDDIKQLLKCQWTDEFVFFQVGERTYCGAKSIIVARCPTLLDKHQLQGDVAAIPISDIDPDIFRAALYFMSYDSLEKFDREAVDDSDPLNHGSFAANLLAAADRFEIKELKSICESRLSEKVSRDSVTSLLHLAHICNAAKLKSACLRFAARNRLVIMESDECEILKESCPLLFLDLAGMGDDFSIPSKNKGLLKAAVSTVRESLIGLRQSLVNRYWVKEKIKMF